MFVPCINSIKALFIFPQWCDSDSRSDMFRFTQEPSSGSHFCA
jgi:hypothetical protein